MLMGLIHEAKENSSSGNHLPSQPQESLYIDLRTLPIILKEYDLYPYGRLSPGYFIFLYPHDLTASNISTKDTLHMKSEG